MKPISLETIELGNLVFGNSRGNFSIEPRQNYQDAFNKFLEQIKADEYGYPIGIDEKLYDNDTFVIRPYYWGDDDEIAKLPNFVYKPDNIEINWYKYPMRDAYCNKDIPLDQFKDILSKCVEAFNKLIN